MKIALVNTVLVLVFGLAVSASSGAAFSGVAAAHAQDSEYDDEDSSEDEECPAGFEESEQKCTPEERENGCRDIRLDNGKGCVDRD